MDYNLHGQGLTMRAGNYPALTVRNHFMMRKDMKRPTIPVAFGPSVEQRGLHAAGARPPQKTHGGCVIGGNTSGYYKRRHTSRKGANKKHRKSYRRRR